MINHEQNAIMLEKRYAKRVKQIRDMRSAHNSQTDNLFTKVTELESEIERLNAHCKRLGEGGAERYWEERWRDEKAENERLNQGRISRIITIEQQEEEIERLRAALNAILNNDGSRGTYDAFGYADARDAAELLISNERGDTDE